MKRLLKYVSLIICTTLLMSSFSVSFSLGLEDTKEVTEETNSQEQGEEATEVIYICGEEEHIHSEECFGEKELKCDKNHKHTDACYGDAVLICEKKEHSHTETCLPPKEEPAEELKDPSKEDAVDEKAPKDDNKEEGKKTDLEDKEGQKEEKKDGDLSAYVPLIKYFEGDLGTSLLYPLRSKAPVTANFAVVDELHPKGHAGIDLGAPIGTPIMAAEAGKVIRAEYYGSYGNCVFISHENGIETRYAHMSEINVKAGDTVKRGQQIGRVGSTGMSTGPHLHFEVLRDGRNANPSLYIEERCAAETKTINVKGIDISVSVEAGALPVGWQVAAKPATITEKAKIDTAVDKIRPEGLKVAKSYAFNIELLDATGGEIASAEESSVKVSFQISDFGSENLLANVYCVEKEQLKSFKLSDIKPEPMPVKTESDIATMEMWDSAFYSMEFLYGKLEYSVVSEEKETVKDAKFFVEKALNIKHDEEVEKEISLDSILSSVGLVGEVSKIETSDPTRMIVEKKDNSAEAQEEIKEESQEEIKEESQEEIKEESQEETEEEIEEESKEESEGTPRWIIRVIGKSNSKEWIKVTVDDTVYLINLDQNNN